MVKSTKPADKTQEEKEHEKKKREEGKRKEREEKEEQERYIQRVRDMIKEDRKTNQEKAQVKIDGVVALQTVSLKESHIKPLTASKDKLFTDSEKDGFTVKIIHETKKQLHTLPYNITVNEFKNLLRTHFSIKNPKAYISTESEIDFKETETLLKSLGVSDMDTIYVHSI